MWWLPAEARITYWKVDVTSLRSSAAGSCRSPPGRSRERLLDVAPVLGGVVVTRIVRPSGDCSENVSVSNLPVSHPQQVFHVDVRSTADFIEAAFWVFAGSGQVSIEGQLKAVAFEELPHTVEPTNILRRQTRYPHQDFFVVELQPALIPVLRDRITDGRRPRAGVLHVQIAWEEMLVLGAYDLDQWGPGGTWISASVGEDLMRQLVSRGAIASYRRDDWPDANTEDADGRRR